MSTLLRPTPVSAADNRRALRWRAGLFAGFALIYSAVSLVNHYLFRTAALDLGLTTHALRDYAHLRGHTSTLLVDSPPTNFLFAHFTLIPALVSPLYWLLGSWTMLVVQIGALLLGGWGVYCFARAQGLRPGLANLVLAYFFSLWAIYSALGFDYHDNVVGAMALPWLVYWFERRRWLPAALAFGLLLISKENLALWAICIMLALAWKHYRHGAVAGRAVLGAVLAALYFVVVTKYLMPALDVEHRPFQQVVRYQHLGSTLPAAVWNTLTHPSLLWQSLFLNITGEAFYNYVKLELWAVLLLSGGVAALLRPWYALMLAPILAQKLLSNDYGLWGINGQYSIELAPVLALAVAELAAQLHAQRQRLYLIGTLALAAAVTVATLYTRQSKWYQRETTNFLLGKHYRSTWGLDAPRLHAALRRIPADVPLSAQTNLAPWLTNRAKLYHFPILRDAQLVALLKTDKSPWPMTPAGYLQAIEMLRTRGDFRVRYEDAQLLVLERTRPAARPDEVLPFQL
ncbi:DUF2079 domain-containing protein [Hymenobacter sp. CRA2]|uniref:DUF2079 domain-containing protein n=1 Tax=Hymenobacter sp. CRA2 TaxID=1955620 RepID=UPI00098FA1F3|nr:DUF2079 domain-containing protein [Hymenobacter sp. CRA2]OON70806.1 hypothetical protein B0919_01990 [Hymenobacter sp. CRA2]